MITDSFHDAGLPSPLPSPLSGLPILDSVCGVLAGSFPYGHGLPLLIFLKSSLPGTTVWLYFPSYLHISNRITEVKLYFHHYRVNIFIHIPNTKSA